MSTSSLVPANEARLHQFLTSGDLGFGHCTGVSETVLSKLYFFTHDVIKWYKPVQAYYGNLLDSQLRREFFLDDYAWNRTISPDIYTKLLGMRYEEQSIRLVSFDEAQDFLIQMNRLNDVTTFSDRLQTQNVSSDVLQNVLDLLIATTRRLTVQPPESLKDRVERGLLSLYRENVVDLQNQLHRAEKFLSIAEADTIIEHLFLFIDNHSYFTHFPGSQLGIAIDCHTDNILIDEHGKVFLIDGMFPKKSWRVIDECHTVARLATNIAVLGNFDKRNEIYLYYRQKYRDFNEKAALVHELRTALMQWSRRHLLGDHDLAEQFHEYALNLLEELGVKKDA
ncbi:MAG TPA: hypothetical protein VJJ02_00025 [Candidatus Paceibacterota bacterium]